MRFWAGLVSVLLSLAGASAQITTEVRAERLPEFLKKLSAQSGVELKSSQALKNEVVVVRALNRPLKTIQDGLATAVGGRWVGNRLEYHDYGRLHDPAPRLRLVEAIVRQARERFGKNGPFRAEPLWQAIHGPRAASPDSWWHLMPGERLADQSLALLTPLEIKELSEDGQLILNTQSRNLHHPMRAELRDSLVAIQNELRQRFGESKHVDIDDLESQLRRPLEAFGPDFDVPSEHFLVGFRLSEYGIEFSAAGYTSGEQLTLSLSAQPHIDYADFAALHDPLWPVAPAGPDEGEVLKGQALDWQWFQTIKEKAPQIAAESQDPVAFEPLEMLWGDYLRRHLLAAKWEGVLLLNDTLFPRGSHKDQPTMDDLRISADRLVEGNFKVYRLGFRTERTDREELRFLVERLRMFPLRSMLDRTIIFEQNSLGYDYVQRLEWRPYDRLEPHGYGMLRVLTKLPRPVLAQLFRGTPTVVAMSQYPAAWQRMVEEIRLGHLRLSEAGVETLPIPEDVIPKLKGPVVLSWEGQGTLVAIHKDQHGWETLSHVLEGRKPEGLERDPQLGPHPLYVEELGSEVVWGKYVWGSLEIRLLPGIVAEDVITYYDFPTKQPK